MVQTIQWGLPTTRGRMGSQRGLAQAGKNLLRHMLAGEFYTRSQFLGKGRPMVSKRVLTYKWFLYDK